MIRPILKRPDVRLKLKAKPVSLFDTELKTLIADMYETMYAARGVGLAANQIGDDRDVFVLDVGQGKEVLINCTILSRKGELKDEEGCLSVPQASSVVHRAESLEIQYQDEEGTWFKRTIDGGLLSRCIQHETDHLAGKLFIDLLSPLKREMALKRAKKRA